MPVVYMTKEKRQEVEDELYKLKTKGRKEMAQKIDISRLSEEEALAIIQELIREKSDEEE